MLNAACCAPSAFVYLVRRVCDTVCACKIYGTDFHQSHPMTSTMTWPCAGLYVRSVSWVHKLALWALMGCALMGPPWAIVGRALMGQAPTGSPGLSWAGP